MSADRRSQTAATAGCEITYVALFKKQNLGQWSNGSMAQWPNESIPSTFGPPPATSDSGGRQSSRPSLERSLLRREDCKGGAQYPARSTNPKHGHSERPPSATA